MAKDLSQQEFDQLVKEYSINIEGHQYVTIESAVLHRFAKDHSVQMVSTYDNKFGCGFHIGPIWAKLSEITPPERKQSAFNSNYMVNDNIFIDTKLDIEHKRIFYKARVEPCELNEFKIKSNDYLQSEILGFYHTDYKSYQAEGNPDYLNILKNQFGNTSIFNLEQAASELKNVLNANLPKIKEIIGCEKLTIVLAPRAKANQEEWYQQLRKSVSEWCDEHITEGFDNGCYYIIRQIDTPTTHMGEGGIYPGIIKATCSISTEIKGKNVLFIDDIYTYGVNIDEDSLQAIMDNKPKTLTFYSVAKTLKKEE